MERRGQLIIDATAVELEIPYPTDLGLLNEARLQSERIIDELWPFSRLGGPKPRTYRQKAKDAYLSVARKRQRSHQAIRKGIKQQLQYLRRNIKTMDALLKTVSAYMLKILLTRRDRQLIATIKLVYDQQQEIQNPKASGSRTGSSIFTSHGSDRSSAASRAGMLSLGRNSRSV